MSAFCKATRSLQVGVRYREQKLSIVQGLVLYMSRDGRFACNFQFIEVTRCEYLLAQRKVIGLTSVRTSHKVQRRSLQDFAVNNGEDSNQMPVQVVDSAVSYRLRWPTLVPGKSNSFERSRRAFLTLMKHHLL